VYADTPREEPPKISPLPAFYQQRQAAYKVLATAGGGSMKSLTQDAHINQQVLILAFGDQWQSQVSAFGRGLNNSSGLHPNYPPVISRVRRLFRPSWGVWFWFHLHPSFSGRPSLSEGG
jgi:hypothetical protein